MILAFVFCFLGKATPCRGSDNAPRHPGRKPPARHALVCALGMRLSGGKRACWMGRSCGVSGSVSGVVLGVVLGLVLGSAWPNLKQEITIHGAKRCKSLRRNVWTCPAIRPAILVCL